jgi:hypothetical protein
VKVVIFRHSPTLAQKGPVRGRREALDEQPTVAHEAIMERAKSYNGFVMTWSEPPVTSFKWTINIDAKDRRRLAKLGRTKVIGSPTCEEALEKAKRFIDSL